MNKSAIMKRAWEIKKENSINLFGLCLKMAWAEAKASDDRKVFDKYARVERTDSWDSAAPECYYTFRLWEKGGKRRIYVNDYKKRTIGYIDLTHNNEIVTDFAKWSDQCKSIKKFFNEYKVEV